MIDKIFLYRVVWKKIFIFWLKIEKEIFIINKKIKWNWNFLYLWKINNFIIFFKFKLCVSIYDINNNRYGN